MRHLEQHRTHRIGWLRAAVLGGVNDGIISKATPEEAPRLAIWALELTGILALVRVLLLSCGHARATLLRLAYKQNGRPACAGRPFC